MGQLENKESYGEVEQILNEFRRHQGIGRRMPDEVYYGLDVKLPKKEAA